MKGEPNKDLELFKRVFSETPTPASPEGWKTIHEPDETPQGTFPTIPGFEFIELLGSGGMGSVYKARQTAMDRLVSVKVMKRELAEDPDFVRRFLVEARNAGKIHHENIVSAVDCGEFNGLTYLVMEFVEGRPLSSVLKERGRIQEGEALDWIRQLGRGLQAAWDQRIIHRDIKPENILITRENVAKLCDLGLSREVGRDQTRVTETGTLLCTPAYASPEQARGEKDLDARSDIYSLGVTLYQLTTGTLPFEAESGTALLIKQVTEKPVPPKTRNPEISPRSNRLILQMIEKSRTARPSSPKAVVEVIDAILAVQDDRLSPIWARLASPSAGRIEGAGSKAQRLQVLARMGVVILASLAFAAVILLKSRWSADDSPPMVAAASSGTAGAPPSPPEVPQDKRLDIPSDAALKEAERTIKSLFKDDYAKRAPADRLALAKNLLKQGIDTKDDNAARYVLFRESQDIAARAGDIETAFRAVDAMSSSFATNSLALKGTALALVSGASRTPEEQKALALAYVALAEDAFQARQFDLAVKASQGALAAAKKVKDVPLLTKAESQSKTMGVIQERYEQVKKSMEALTANPNSPEANQAVGEFECLTLGDWEAGLPKMAKGSDPALKDLAVKDLSKPKEGPELTALGDAWWDRAEKESGLTRSNLRQRAAHWYQQASSKLSGLSKVKVDKRLEELGGSKSDRGVAEVGKGDSSRLMLDLGSGIKIECISIKPGTFIMGGPDAPLREWQRDERPAHRVTITKGYHLGKYPVTRGQFAVFVKDSAYITDAERTGKAHCWIDGGWKEINGASWRSVQPFTQTDDHPAVCISWNDAKAFCDWAAKKTGRPVALPTEAEWEYACRAGTKTRWWFGDTDEALADAAWTIRHSGMQSHPVGQKKPNPWGLFDLYGHAWQWCQDWWGPYGADAVDPVGPATGDRKCIRGGGWAEAPIDCRTSFRGATPPIGHDASMGFRVAVH